MILNSLNKKKTISERLHRKKVHLNSSLNQYQTLVKKISKSLTKYL